MGRTDRTLLVVLGISAVFYYFLCYDTPRHQFTQLMALFFGLFVGYFFILYLFSKTPPSSKTLSLVVGGAILFRIIAWFALPELSDDYFRFLWDGHLLVNGENPFSQIPSAWPQEAYISLGLTEELYTGLNSKNYFTIYPPVCQGIFFLSAFAFPKSIYGGVVCMKAFFFLMEMLTIGLIIKLLKQFVLPAWCVVFYALNPLVVVECVGNLHFETLMIGFLLLSIWLLTQKRWMLAALPFALAICSKLLPLVFMPLLIRRIGWGKAIAFGAIVLGLTGLAFLPLFDVDTLRNLFSSISLYFQTFEFNASIYYLVRAAGYYFVGYNIIGTAGKVLAALTLVGILLMAFLEENPTIANLPRSMVWALTIYFAFAAIVHPWYICPLVALCLLSDVRFPIIWTFLLPMTYLTYQTEAYEENLWLVGIEYVLVTGYLVYEWKNRKLKRYSSVE